MQGPFGNVHFVARVIWWLFPGLFLVISWYLAHAWAPAAPLLMPISLEAPEKVGLAIACQLIISIVWLIAEFWFDSSIRTRSDQIKVDMATSVFWAIVMTWFATWSYFNDNWQWFLVVPVVMTIVEAFVSSWTGVNNATQKAIMQHGPPA